MDVLWILPFEDNDMSLDLFGYNGATIHSRACGIAILHRSAITPCCDIRLKWRHRADTFFCLFCSASRNPFLFSLDDWTLIVKTSVEFVNNMLCVDTHLCRGEVWRF